MYQSPLSIACIIHEVLVSMNHSPYFLLCIRILDQQAKSLVSAPAPAARGRESPVSVTSTSTESGACTGGGDRVEGYSPGYFSCPGGCTASYSSTTHISGVASIRSTSTSYSNRWLDVILSKLDIVRYNDTIFFLLRENTECLKKTNSNNNNKQSQRHPE